jgi:hypothetical protein
VNEAPGPHVRGIDPRDIHVLLPHLGRKVLLEERELGSGDALARDEDGREGGGRDEPLDVDVV